MTIEPVSTMSSSPWGDLEGVGLEDVGASDISMPRLSIVHDQARFKDNSTGEEFETLECVILGLVKQRIMWDTEVDEGDKPQCKSPDYEHGYPQMRTDIPVKKQFPWARSNFNAADFPPDENGQVALPCEACSFAKWGPDRTKPSCSEQYTYALYYRAADGTMRPGLLSFQRSAMKAAKTYTGTFGASRTPMFTVMTLLSLKLESRGKVVYSVPTFVRGGASDSDEWAGYAEGYRSIRDYLRQPPRPTTKEEEGGATKSSAPRTPATATAATKLAEDDPWASSAPASSAASEPGDDELPF